jgi:hypothetical protein
MLDANIKELLKNREEVQKIDLYLRVREQLVFHSDVFLIIFKDVELKIKGDPKLISRLEEHVIAIVDCLSPELQNEIKKQVLNQYSTYLLYFRKVQSKSSRLKIQMKRVK